jgi:hypothetical protein
MAQPFQELVLSSSSASTVLNDIGTGSTVLSFKAPASRTGGPDEKPLTTFVPSAGGLGGVILGSAGGKAPINVWGFQKASPVDLT